MVFQSPKRLIKINDKARFVCLALVFIAAVLFFESTGLLEGINNYCYNLAFRLRGERNHDNRIIIAAIDEKNACQTRQVADSQVLLRRPAELSQPGSGSGNEHNFF